MFLDRLAYYLFPYFLSPVWGDYAVSQSPRYHSAVVGFRAKYMAAATERPQVAELIGSQLTRPDVINVAFR